MYLNENNVWVTNDGVPIRWLNEKEGAIIGPFFSKNYKTLGRYLKLKLKDGSEVITFYEGEGQSDNDLELDDPNFEDCTEFYFDVIKVIKKSKEDPFKLHKGHVLFLRYWDFPFEYEILEDYDEEKYGKSKTRRAMEKYYASKRK